MRVSTIIPAYNRATLIGETLRSVLSQTRPPFEVIVVDDGSTDGTSDVVTEQFGNNVRLLRQRNAGAGPARNAGFARSTGDIIHFMDSDDIISLNSYQVQAAAIEAGAEMVYGPWLKTEFDGNLLIPEPFVLQQGALPDNGKLHLLTIMTLWVTVFQPCLFSRKLIDRVGPYRDDLKPSEDTEMLYRLSCATKKLAHSSETLVLYRVHPENQVSEQNRELRTIDKANLWALLQDYAAQQQDFSKWRRVLFNLRKLQVAIEVQSMAKDKSELLKHGTGAFYHMAAPLYGLHQRIVGKIRMLATGNPYSRIFRAAPLTDGQKCQIRQLGYKLPEQFC